MSGLNEPLGSSEEDEPFDGAGSSASSSSATTLTAQTTPPAVLTEEQILSKLGPWVNMGGKFAFRKYFQTRQHKVGGPVLCIVEVGGVDDEGQAKICGVQLRRSDWGTAIMKNHLYYSHRKLWDEIQPKQTVLGFEPSEKPSHIEALIKYQVSNYQPYSLVENRDFLDYSHSLNPKAKIPGQHAYRMLVHDKYLTFQDKLDTKIENQKLAVTTDGWTSKSKHSYYAYTLHWIDENFVLQSCPLAITVCKGDTKHT